MDEAVGRDGVAAALDERVASQCGDDVVEDERVCDRGLLKTQAGVLFRRG